MVQDSCIYFISQTKRKNERENPKMKNDLPRVPQFVLILLVLPMIMTCYIKMILGKM